MLWTACETASSPRLTALLNGKDLDGWIIMHGGAWFYDRGVLVGRDGQNWSTNPEVPGSWLRSEREYGDFTLDLDYAISSRGNGGIFIRSGLEKNPAFTGHEMQIIDDRGRPPSKSTTGALYDVVAPKLNMSRPAGEWNHVRINTRGPRIQIWLNGLQIVDYTSDRQTRGYIGFQAHDDRSELRLRNIRISEP